MRSKADKTFVRVETLICPLQISHKTCVSAVFVACCYICLLCFLVSVNKRFCSLGLLLFCINSRGFCSRKVFTQRRLLFKETRYI